MCVWGGEGGGDRTTGHVSRHHPATHLATTSHCMHPATATNATQTGCGDYTRGGALP
jgi:hypothetical protein